MKLLTTLLLLFGFTGLAAVGATDFPLTVDTSSGQLTGEYRTVNGIEMAVWEGIPYAQPPVGPLRWEMPVPFVGNDPLDTTEIKSACMQSAFITYPNNFPPEYARANATFYNPSEDCLYLNVYRPRNQPIIPWYKPPVFVWVHGGGFTTGDPFPDHWPMEHLVDETNMIFVSVAYRLDGFGNFPLDNLPPNLSLEDTRLALKWVRDNIIAFGGNPLDVNIFGQSAGGANVLYQLADSDLLNGDKIRKLGVRTVYASSAAPTQAVPIEVQRDNAELVANILGCYDPATRVACLKAYPTELIHQGLQAASFSGAYFGPTYGEGTQFDDKLLNLFEDGKFDKTVKVMIGNSKQEGEGFLDVAYGLPEPNPVFPITDPAFQFAVGTYQAIFGVPIINAQATDITPEFFAIGMGILYGNQVDQGQLLQIIAYYGNYAQQNQVTLWKALSRALTAGTFACPNDIMSRALSEHTKVYRYELTHGGDYPIYNVGASHSSELPYVFGEPWTGFFPVITQFSSREVDFSHQLIDFLQKFARFQRPTIGGGNNDSFKPFDPTDNSLVLKWTPYEGQPLSQFLIPTPESTECQFWRQLLVN